MEYRGRGHGAWLNCFFGGAALLGEDKGPEGVGIGCEVLVWFCWLFFFFIPHGSEMKGSEGCLCIIGW